jgi:chloramphenicol-sensitive protein RarD
MQESSKGLLTAGLAFLLWGMFPLYFKAVGSALPVEILCHRIVWSLLVTFSLLFVTRKAGNLRKQLQNKKILLPYVLSSILISVNWLLYIWAVTNDFIVEASLGYYINPLINVVLGMIFLKERLRFGQWFSVFLAFTGVCYLTLFYGHFPWIAIVLAFAFGFYGLLRKITPLPSLEGLCLETFMLSIPATGVLFYLISQGQADFVHQDISGKLLLASSGIITSLPLLLFGFAAHRIPLATLGVVQYMTPTLQLVIGVFVYGEAFPEQQMIGFVLVWCGLVIYAIEGTIMQIKQKRACRVMPAKQQVLQE